MIIGTHCQEINDVGEGVSKVLSTSTGVQFYCAFPHILGFFFLPPRSKIGGGGYCFGPVCHSVLLSETLTLLITFEQ